MYQLPAMPYNLLLVHWLQLGLSLMLESLYFM